MWQWLWQQQAGPFSSAEGRGGSRCSRFAQHAQTLKPKPEALSVLTNAQMVLACDIVPFEPMGAGEKTPN